MIALAAVLAWPPASFAQVKVIMSGGFSAAFEELQPLFEKTSGITVTTARDPRKGTDPIPSAPNFAEAYQPTW